MIKKVVNGEAKAVSRICKRSYNLFDLLRCDKPSYFIILKNGIEGKLWASNVQSQSNQLVKSLKPNTKYLCTYTYTQLEDADYWYNQHGGKIVLYNKHLGKSGGSLGLAKKFLSKGEVYNNTGTVFTTPADLTGFELFFYAQHSATDKTGEKPLRITKGKFENVQIVEGTETKPYVPYLLDVNKAKKVIDVTDQMTNSVGNPYWSKENQEWTGAHMTQREYCMVGNSKSIFDKYGLQRYVVEFDGRSEVAGQMRFYILKEGDHGYSIPITNLQFATDWQHYEIAFIPTIINNNTEGRCDVSFYGVYDTGRVPHIKNFKIRTAVDVFTHVMSEVADGVVEVSPAKVSEGMLTIKGDNVKVENNKLIIQ